MPTFPRQQQFCQLVLTRQGVIARLNATMSHLGAFVKHKIFNSLSDFVYRTPDRVIVKTTDDSPTQTFNPHTPTPHTGDQKNLRRRIRLRPWLGYKGHKNCRKVAHDTGGARGHPPHQPSRRFRRLSHPCPANSVHLHPRQNTGGSHAPPQIRCDNHHVDLRETL